MLYFRPIVRNFWQKVTKLSTKTEFINASPLLRHNTSQKAGYLYASPLKSRQFRN